jgi:two-component system response regulator YesN
MYRAFIADDEIYVRNGLKKHFPWNKYNIEIVGEAGNGEEALNKILKRDVDIVITDVLMPLLDGIELAKALSEKGNKSKIIFISGYDDIKYLRSALKLDAIDYIMKSIDLNELEETIKKVISLIDKERSEKTFQNLMKVKLEQSMPLLQEKILRMLIKDTIEPSHEIEDKISLAGLDLSNNGIYFVCVISLQNFYSLYMDKSEMSRQLLSLGMLNILNEIFSRYFTGYMFESGIGEFIAIINYDEKFTADIITPINDFSNDVYDAFKKYYNLKVLIGYNGPAYGLKHLKESYEGSLRIAAVNSTARTFESYTHDISDYEQDLLSSLGGGNEEMVYQIIESIFKNINPSETLSNIQNSLFSLLMLPTGIISELDLTKETPYIDIRRLCEQYFLCDTLSVTHDYIRNVYGKILHAINIKKDDQNDIIVNRIKVILKDRYTSNLSINDIAKEVFLTPEYICLLFKHKTGTTINKYLTALRIDKAKKLLANPQKKIYEVCYALGYKSPCYFTKLFRHYTGLTPNEYRNITTNTDS